MALQSEVDYTIFDNLIALTQIRHEKEKMHHHVEYLSEVKPQLVGKFQIEFNKIRPLCNADIGKEWATVPLKNISRVHYTFDQLVLALKRNEMSLSARKRKLELLQRNIPVSSIRTLEMLTNSTTTGQVI